MNLHISENDSGVIREAADFVLHKALNAVKAHGRFSWALSGGSSPKRLFELLAKEYADQFPWKDTYFFFGDERNVPHDSEESNYRMARLAMLDPMNVSDDHVFPVDTSLNPRHAAESYESEIRNFFSGTREVIDLVMLGLGDDAHTASLFPGTDILENDHDLVASVFLEDKNVYRISFTKRLINQAACVAFLTYGQNKAEAVGHVFGTVTNYNLYPAQLISPRSGELHWFMDKAAAVQID